MWLYTAAQWPEVLPLAICCHSLTLLSLPLQFQDAVEWSVKVISPGPGEGNAICARQTYMNTMILQAAVEVNEL